LLAIETPVAPPAPTATSLASRLAGRYFGSLPATCANLFTATPTDLGDPIAAPTDYPAGEAAPMCGFVLHPAAANRLPLIRLGTPHLESRLGYARLSYPVVGGLLVRTAVAVSGHSGVGSFSFEVTVVGASTTFAVRVDDFAARLLGGGTSFLRRLLYLATESLVHRVLVARFLRRFVRSLPL
jgi:hypothetical protein